jgi:hypothetical protein
MIVMDTNEDTTQEVENTLSPLHKVTPLSKYFAMVLFVALPFIGGWIGYTYAPEKVVEVERVVIKEVSSNDINSVIDSSGQVIPETEYDREAVWALENAFDDAVVYKDFQTEYIFSREPYYYDHGTPNPIVCLPNRNNGAASEGQSVTFSDTCGLYKFNQDTDRYDIELSDNFNSIGQSYKLDDDIGDGGLIILASMSTSQRIYFGSILWEGGGMLPLYYVDTSDVSAGLIATNFLVNQSTSPSPDQSNFFALTQQNEPMVVNLKTLDVTPLPELNNRCLVWGNQHSGGRDSYRMLWIDNETLEITHYYKDDCLLDTPRYSIAKIQSSKKEDIVWQNNLDIQVSTIKL